jgi:hypothetical protein
MQRMATTYTLRAKSWIYQGVGAWHFVTLPKKEAAEIKKQYGTKRRGWGSIRVRVTIGKTSWQTSIFPDSKLGSYVLPLKAEVRKKEHILERDTIQFSLALP